MADIQKIDIIKDNKLKSEGIVFKVANGLGKLKIKNVNDENGKIRECLFLDDIPVIMYDKEYNLNYGIKVQIAEGRECIDEDIIESLKIMNNVKSLEDGFEKLNDIFSLLEDGYYILKDLKMIPTNGEGNFFWHVDGRGRNYKSAVDFYEKNYKIIDGYEKFLISSQSLNLYNEKQVSYYREKIKKGENPYVLALSMRGFCSILIDGHHKASAAFLEGEYINCLNITPCILLNDKYEKKRNIQHFENNTEKLDCVKNIVFSGIKCKEINIDKKNFYPKIEYAMYDEYFKK